MTLQVGDKVVTIPGRDGGRVTVRSGTISVGDKAVLIPGANGQIFAVKPASPQVGDKVILYPLRNGGHVCLASADDEGEEPPLVLPPINFSALRTAPGTAALEWALNEGNTAVRIVRRPDRYPVHINDGTVAYEGAGDETTDSGLDYRLPYYYCAWGKAGSNYSNGYLMKQIWAWGCVLPPGSYFLEEIVDYVLGLGGEGESLMNMLGNNNWTHTYIGSLGWVEAAWHPLLDLHTVSQVRVYEKTTGYYSLTLNPNDYIYPNEKVWDLYVDDYAISFKYPNIIRIRVTNYALECGNICWVRAVVP